MQVYFSKDWLALVELSFRNFLAEAIEHLPLPTLLRFDTDRLQRSSLQKQVERLQTETADLKQQLSVCSKGNSAASDQQSTQRSQQHQQPRTHHATVNSHSDGPVQHHIRPPQEGKAAAPPVAPKPELKRQHNSSDTSNMTSFAETRQWGLANGEEDTQSSTANKVAEGSLDDNSHHLHPQAGARITPRWSASLASLATSVLADSDTGTPQQQASAADEPQDSDVDASSLHSLQSDTQLSSQAGMSVATNENQVRSARLSSGQGNLATGQQQTAPPLQPQLSDAQPNKDSQSQHSSEADSLHRRTDDAETVLSSQSDPAVEQLEGHDSSVTCCTFSPSGQNLATASTDGVVRISAPVSLQVHPSFVVALDLTYLSVSCVSVCIVYHGRPSRST